MQDTEQERYSWLKLGGILLIFLLFGLMAVLGGDGEMPFNMDDANNVLIMKILQAVSVVILFIAPAVLFAVFLTKAKIHYLGITKKPLFLTLLIGALGMLLAMPLINYLAQLNQGMHLPEAMSGIENWMRTSEDKATELTEAFTRGTSVGTLILNLFVVAFMAALSEELFFRGMLQKVLIECFKNKHVAIWIGAALFSAFHMQFFGFVPRMVMGAFLGYLFLWSGSIWPSIGAHFVNNGVAVFLVWLVNRGTISKDVDKIGAESSQLVFVLISSVIVLGSLFLIYKLEKNKKQKMIE